MIDIDRNYYKKCILCPRRCKKDRTENEIGVCGVSDKVKLARAALHFWEEPCVSGNNGSGAVFFSGCSLHCVFCQNEKIANAHVGKEVSDDRLSEIFLELQEKGANNINLVTPGQFIPHIISAVEESRNQGLTIPIVYNTSSYETVDNIKRLEGIVDVYLPDLKYYDSIPAARYSRAKDYPLMAMAAIEEMIRQKPYTEFVPEKDIRKYQSIKGIDEVEEGYIIKSGVIVRHLLLPGMLEDSKKITEYLHTKYGEKIYISLMSQFTPLENVKGYPELDRTVTAEEYDALVQYAIDIGVEKGFIQEGEVAEESFIPEFDCEGV